MNNTKSVINSFRDITYCVYVPPKKLFKVFFEIISGVVRNLKKNIPVTYFDIDSMRVKSFFYDRSEKDDFHDFTESTTSWYINILSKSKILNEKLKDKTLLKILDLGCGRAGLYQWINQQRKFYETKYLGVDFDDIAIARCKDIYNNQNINFVSHDINEPSKIFDEHYDIIFCINIFPYIREIKDLIRHMSKSCAVEDGIVVVVDPLPSPYWEREFGGFVIAIREPKTVHNIFSDSGFNLMENGILYSLKFFNTSCFPLSILHVWDRGK